MKLMSSSLAARAEGVRSGLRAGVARRAVGNFALKHTGVGPLTRRDRRCLTLVTRADFLPFDGAGCKRAWRWPLIRRPGKTRKGSRTEPSRPGEGASATRAPLIRIWALHQDPSGEPLCGQNTDLCAIDSTSMLQSIRRHQSAARRRLTKGPVTSSLPVSLMMGRCPR